MRVGGAAMMKRWIFAAAAFLVVASRPPVLAADLDMAPPVLAQPEPSFFGSGWYIRGDVGYSIPQGEKASYNGVAFSSFDVQDSVTVGLGIGYKYNAWLRTDVTVDASRGGDVKGTYTVPTCCFYTDKTKLGGYTALANVYADLGTWSGITPYIGAGIGYAYNQVGAGSGYAYTAPGVPLLDASGNQVFNAFPKHNSSGLAWALMAGASMNIAPGVAVDLGYRYLRVADASSAPDFSKISTHFTSLGAHQFRIGLRYLFDQ
jgi:opacity protein-like surface antigen